MSTDAQIRRQNEQRRLGEEAKTRESERVRRNELLADLRAEQAVERPEAIAESVRLANERLDARLEGIPVDPLLLPTVETPGLEAERELIEQSARGAEVGYGFVSCVTSPPGLSYCDGMGHAVRHYSEVYRRWMWVHSMCPKNLARRAAMRGRDPGSVQAQKERSSWRT